MTLALKNCTNFKSRQLARLLTRHYDAELSGSGLKVTQFSLLSVVLRHGPIHAGALANRMEIDPSTLTRNIQPLLKAGWLQLSAGSDGRSRTITISPAGIEKQAEAKKHWHVAQQRINQLLGHERVASLTSLIDECIVHLQSERNIFIGAVVLIKEMEMQGGDD